MNKIQLIHALDAEFEVEKVPTAYAASKMVYILTDNQDFIKFSRTLYETEKERNEWIRSYDKVLKGLNYWKNKALEK